MAKKKVPIEDMIQQAQNRIQLAEMKVRALYFASRELTQDGEARAEYSALWGALHRHVNEAYRDYFIWCLVDARPEIIRKARVTALTKYLTQEMSLSGYMSPSFKDLSSWSLAVEDEIREAIEVARKEVGLRRQKKGR